MMPVPHSIKAIIAFVFSLDVILTSIVIWLQKLNHFMSDWLSVFVTCAGLVVTYYTIIHIKEKIQGQKLDNIIKRLDIEEREKKN